MVNEFFERSVVAEVTKTKRRKAGYNINSALAHVQIALGYMQAALLFTDENVTGALIEDMKLLKNTCEQGKHQYETELTASTSSCEDDEEV